MIDAYKIGARIILNDDVLATTAKWADQLTNAQVAIDRLNISMRETVSLTRSAASSASTMASAFGRAADAAERIQRASSGGFVISGGGSGGGGGGGGGGGSGPYLPGGGGDGDRPRLPGPGGGMATTQNWTPGQNPPVPFPAGGGQDDRGHGVSGHDIYGAMFAGGLAFTGISAFATGLATNVEAIQKPRALLIGQGVPASMADQMIAAARQIQKNQPGVSFAGALGMIYDTYTVTKNGPESIAAAPGLATDMFNLHEIGDDQGGGDLYDLVKAAEIKGTLTTKNKDGSVNIQPLLNAVDLATKVSIATGGKLQPADAFRIAQNAGPIFKSLDDDAYVEALLLSNELGPSRVGTGLQGFGRQLVGGKMSKQQAEMFSKLGLLDMKKFHPGAMGYGYVESGGFKDQDEIAANPFEYINDDIVPSLLKANPKDRNSIIRGISQMFSTVPGQRLAISDILSQAVLDRQESAVYSLPGTQQTAAGYRKNDPGVALTGFTQSFDALLTELGSPLIKTAVGALNEMRQGINSWADAMHDHPARALATDGGIAASIVAGGILLFKGVSGAFSKDAKAAESFWDKAMKDLPGGGEAAGGGADAAFSEVAVNAVKVGVAQKIVGPVGLAALFVEQVRQMLGVPLPFTAGAGGHNPITGAPTGKPNDPFHVKVVGTSTGTTMPTGQTGHNPAQSPPVPGQVFSPP